MKNNNTNQIHPTAKIGENVILGSYNVIGENVVIEGFKDKSGVITIGDCNIINDNTKILAGEEGIKIGDWNVFHNNMLVMAERKMIIGHNCWFGQNTILDASGGLELGNGVRVGMYSQIWSHVASGELIEGCTLYGNRKTIIKDDVWLVGSCIVSSGVILGERGIFLIGSNITKNTESNKVYAGSPAKIMEKLSFYGKISLDEKFELMKDWIKEFVKINPQYNFIENKEQLEIVNPYNDDKIVIIRNGKLDGMIVVSVFNLTTKRYNKTLSELERVFYKFLYNHKARFIPEND